MVEAELSPKENILQEEAPMLTEAKPQIRGDRLHIITSEALGARCTELSKKMGLNEKVVIDDIFSVGSMVIEVLAEGNHHAIVTIKDGKFNVAGFKD